jgi:hypothetical protein
MTLHDEVVQEIQLALGHPDLRRRPLQELDDEHRRVVEAPAVRKIGTRDGLSRHGHDALPSAEG